MAETEHRGNQAYLKKVAELVSLKGWYRASWATAAMSEPEKPSVQSAKRWKSAWVKLWRSPWRCAVNISALACLSGRGMYMRCNTAIQVSACYYLRQWESLTPLERTSSLACLAEECIRAAPYQRHVGAVVKDIDHVQSHSTIGFHGKHTAELQDRPSCMRYPG